MTIVFLVNEVRFFRTHRLAVARALRELGYSITVVAGVGEAAVEESARLRDAGLSVKMIPFSRSSANPWGELQTIVGFLRVLQRMRPVAVHHIGFKAVVNGTHAVRLSSVSPAVVNHVTGLGHMYAVEGSRERLCRSIMNMSFASAFRIVGRQRIIVQNPDDRRLLRSAAWAPDKKLRVILGSGVDTKRFRKFGCVGNRPKGRVVLFASRLLWSKGVGEFVKIARGLRAEFAEVRWIIVGEPDEGNVGSVPRKTIEDWASEPGIEWWGWRDDMEQIYQYTDVFCLPTTYREGVPKVLIEAASCELPLVATDVPGCREIVRHEENGLLVRRGDTDELMAAVRLLLQNPTICKRMGARGRAIVKEMFSEERVVQQTLDVSDELLFQGGALGSGDLSTDPSFGSC